MPTDARTILLTGATDGIGRQTAFDLAARGARLVLHGRSDAKLAAVSAALDAAHPGAVAGTLLADLGDLDAIRTAVAKFAPTRPLDVLLLNAGVFMTERAVTRDGFEATMAVNHFGPLLLTELLLAQTASRDVARIVLVSSVAHLRAALSLDDLALTRTTFDGYGAYAASKLANVLTAVALADRLAGRTTVNSLHPGVVSTKLLKAGFGMKGPDSLAAGASTSVMLALDPVGGAVTGRYFAAGREAAAHPLARDGAFVREFYARSRALVGLAPTAPPHAA